MPKIIYLRRLPKHQYGEWADACKNADRGTNDIFVIEDTWEYVYVFPELGPVVWFKGEFEILQEGPTEQDSSTQVAQKDAVINPNHYDMMGANTIEILAAAMTEAEWRGFCLGNTLKYRIRAGKKDDLQQDIDKANNYERLYEKHKHLCRKDKEQFLYCR